jgi:hypothetical protein
VFAHIKKTGNDRWVFANRTVFIPPDILRGILSQAKHEAAKQSLKPGTDSEPVCHATAIGALAL